MDREQILQSAPEMKPETIDIPEWGGTFELQPMTGAQLEEVMLLVEQARASGNFMCLRGLRAKVAIWVLTKLGEAVFRAADATALTNKWSPVLTRIYDRAKMMNGLTAEAQAAIEKN